MSEYIKSPLNYTGNKHRLLNEIISRVPKNTSIILDLFCGGTSVGLNSKVEEVIFVDKNEKLINLLKFLKKNKFEYILNKLEYEIIKYNLTNSYRNTYKYYKDKIKIEKLDENENNGLRILNKEGYFKLREDYNLLNNKDSEEGNIKLYLLMLYSFNNDIRFNRYGKFNLPVGKTDLNNVSVKKLNIYLEYIKKKKFKYICMNFEDIKMKKIIENVDFVYLDPPYLITTAVYNESDGWTVSNEIQLLKLLDYFLKINKPFILSNVLCKGEKYNKYLNAWIKQNKSKILVEYLDMNYKSASYNKKNRVTKELEIIVHNIF